MGYNPGDFNGISGGKSSTYNSGELTPLRFVGWTTKYLIKIRWFGDSGIVLPIFYVSWKDHLWMRNCSLPRLPEAQNHPKFPWQFGWNFPQALVSWQKFPIFRKQMKVSMAMQGTPIVGWFRIKEKSHLKIRMITRGTSIWGIPQKRHGASHGPRHGIRFSQHFAFNFYSADYNYDIPKGGPGGGA